MVSIFPGNSLKLMPPDALILAYNSPKSFGGRAPSGPAGRALKLPQTRSLAAKIGDLLLRGGRGEDGGDKMGGEGKGGDGQGKEGKKTSP